MSTFISVGQLLPGRSGERIADGAVLVDAGQIVAVGTRAEVEPAVPATAARMDFPGATLLPGLIDCHVHLAFSGGPDTVAAVTESSDDDLLTSMAGRARQLLEIGVTTVRDLGDRGALSVRLRDEIVRGDRRGPRIVAATAPLTAPGGHCWFLGGEVSGEPAIRELVRRNADNGADVIKVMATGGHLTPDGPSMTDSQFTAADLRAVVDEAHRRGLPVAAHSHGTDGIVAAVDAGVDTIEHCTWLTESGFDARPATAREMVAKGISVCPAVAGSWRGYARRFGQEIADALLDRLRWLDEQGVTLVAGTDAGIPGASFDGYVDGLHAFAHAGFTNPRIIELATVRAAHALRLAGTTGQVAPGLAADLLIVDGDPTTDLDALREVRLVLARGRAHAPSAAGASA